MKHKVTFNEKDKVVEIKYVGDISVGDVEQIKKQMDEILQGTTTRHLVADVSESPMIQISKDARMEMAEMGKSLDLDRIAIIGANPMNRMLGKIVLSLFSKSNDSRFFKTKQEALSWLKGGAE